MSEPPKAKGIDRTSDLREALETLNAFAESNRKACLQNQAGVSMQKRVRSSLLHAIATMSSAFRKLQRKPLPQDVVAAEHFVIRNAFLISHFNKGDKGQQQFAKKALEIIKKYYNILGQNSSWAGRFKGLFSGGDGTLQKVSKRKAEKVSAKVSHVFISPHIEALSKVEQDLFQMKTFIQLRKLGFSDKCIAKTFKDSKTPLVIIPGKSNKEITTFCQRVSLLPGATIELTGAIASKDPATVRPRFPIENSFKVLPVEWTQSGYPHPSQHNSWALSEELIPICPANLPHLQSLFEKKERIVEGLKFEGPLVPRAIELLLLKRKVFKENLPEMLSLSRQLDEQLLMMAGRPPSNAILDDFYPVLPALDKTYDEISSFRQTMLETFVGIPRKALEKALVKAKKPLETYAHTEKFLLQTISSAKREILKKAEQSKDHLERCFLCYIALLGESLGKLAAPILIQEFSKVIGFQARELPETANRLQTLLYLHLHQFEEELQWDFLPTTEQMEDRLKSLLLKDICILQNRPVEASPSLAAAQNIVRELQLYYLPNI